MAPVGTARRVGAAPLHALWLTGKYAVLRLAAQARPGAARQVRQIRRIAIGHRAFARPQSLRAQPRARHADLSPV